MKNRLKLKDWKNAGETRTRFPNSIYDCPECGEKALMDEWPPNYGHGSGAGGLGNMRYTSEESIKHVCTNCKIAFRVFHREVTAIINNDEFRGQKILENTVTYSETIPLVEKDGYLLTPHDVKREDYKEEHGEYPQEVHG